MKLFLLAILINFFLAIFRILYVLFYPIDLSPEEAQYWDWSRHLDFSYYSKPPLVAYLNFISTSLLGNTEIGVRITPIILSFILSVLTFLFVKKLFDEKTAFLSSVLPNFFIGTSINSILMTTDAPFIFFWAVSVMLIYLAVEKNTYTLWLLVGLFAGLSFLSKYTAVFLFPLTLFYLFIKGKILNPRPYISLIPAFILSLPVLYWNIKHDFVSFKHISSLAGKRSNFPNLDTFIEFLGGQIILLSIIPFFFLLYGWYVAIKKRDEKLIFLTVYSLPVFLFFLFLSLRKEVYANWSGFAYFTGSILSVIFMKRVILYVFPVCFFLTLLLHFTPLFDVLNLRKLLPPEKDPVKVMVGWEKLGKEVSKLKKEGEFIFSNAYQISAELAFYVEGNPRTFVFHMGRMTQYYFWKEELKKCKGKDAIFVSYWGLPKVISEHFEGYEFLKEIKVYWRGKEIRKFKVYRLKGFKGEFKERIRGF